MTDITRFTQEIKAAAEKAKYAGEAPVMPFDTRISTLNEYQLTVCPDNVLTLVEALELKEEQRANWFQMAQKLGEDLDAAEKRIAELEDAEQKLCAANVTLDARAELAERQLAELESRLNSADKLQDGAFRSGLQHGFSLGQTDDQKGYEHSMAAYSPAAGIKWEAE